MHQNNHSNSISIPISKKTLRLQLHAPLAALANHLETLNQPPKQSKNFSTTQKQEDHDRLAATLVEIKSSVENMQRFIHCIMNQAQEASIASTESEDGRWLSILIIDDDERIQRFHYSMLNCFNCSVNIASNGYEALSMLSHPYDVILIDIHMPGIDGIETATLIRHLGSGAKDIPIIAITATPLAEIEENLKSQLFYKIMEKPINIEKLQAVLTLLPKK